MYSWGPAAMLEMLEQAVQCNFAGHFELGLWHEAACVHHVSSALRQGRTTRHRFLPQETSFKVQQVLPGPAAKNLQAKVWPQIQEQASARHCHYSNLDYRLAILGTEQHACGDGGCSCGDPTSTCFSDSTRDFDPRAGEVLTTLILRMVLIKLIVCVKPKLPPVRIFAGDAYLHLRSGRINSIRLGSGSTPELIMSGLSSYAFMCPRWHELQYVQSCAKDCYLCC